MRDQVNTMTCGLLPSTVIEPIDATIIVTCRGSALVFNLAHRKTNDL